jgi:hypothetical protein
MGTSQLCRYFVHSNLTNLVLKSPYSFAEKIVIGFFNFAYICVIMYYLCFEISDVCLFKFVCI